MSKSYHVRKVWIFITILIVVLGQLLIQGANDLEKGGSLAEKIYSALIKNSIEQYNPYMLYMNGIRQDGNPGKRILY